MNKTKLKELLAEHNMKYYKSFLISKAETVIPGEARVYFLFDTAGRDHILKEASVAAFNNSMRTKISFQVRSRESMPLQKGSRKCLAYRPGWLAYGIWKFESKAWRDLGF
jgi:hypothetical protein